MSDLLGKSFWLAAGFSLIFSATAAENLLKNGGFEQAGEDKIPKAWQSSDTVVARGYEGKALKAKCVIALPKGANCRTEAIQSLESIPAGKYKLSGKIFGSGIYALWTGVAEIKGKSKKMFWIDRKNFIPEKNKPGWFRFESTFQLDEPMNESHFVLQAFGSKNAEARFDNLFLGKD